MRSSFIFLNKKKIIAGVIIAILLAIGIVVAIVQMNKTDSVPVAEEKPVILAMNENSLTTVDFRLSDSTDTPNEYPHPKVSVTVNIEEGDNGLSPNNSYQYYVSSSATSLEGGSWKNYEIGNAIEITDNGRKYVFFKILYDRNGNEVEYETIFDGWNKVQIGNEYYIVVPNKPFTIDNILPDGEIYKYINYDGKIMIKISYLDNFAVDKVKFKCYKNDDEYYEEDIPEIVALDLEDYEYETYGEVDVEIPEKSNIYCTIEDRAGNTYSFIDESDNYEVLVPDANNYTMYMDSYNSDGEFFIDVSISELEYRNYFNIVYKNGINGQWTVGNYITGMNSGDRIYIALQHKTEGTIGEARIYDVPDIKAPTLGIITVNDIRINNTGTYENPHVFDKDVVFDHTNSTDDLSGIRDEELECQIGQDGDTDYIDISEIPEFSRYVMRIRLVATDFAGHRSVGDWVFFRIIDPAINFTIEPISGDGTIDNPYILDNDVEFNYTPSTDRTGIKTEQLWFDAQVDDDWDTEDYETIIDNYKDLLLRVSIRVEDNLGVVSYIDRTYFRFKTPSAEDAITFEEGVWQNGEYTLNITNSATDYIIQYKVGNADNWSILRGNSIPGLSEGDVVHVRLIPYSSEENAGEETIFTVRDTTKPTVPVVQITGESVDTNTYKGGISINVTPGQDGETGVSETVYTINNGNEIKIDSTGKINVTEPGTYVIKVITKDKAGNTSEKVVNVTILEKEEDKYISPKGDYIIDTNKNVIKNISTNSTVTEFEKNITGNMTYTIYDAKDNHKKQGTELIKTGDKLITEDGKEYTLIVKGDVNSDGLCDIVDLSMEKRAIIKSIEFTETQKIAGDINEDKSLDVIDLSNIVRFIIKEIVF